MFSTPLKRTNYFQSSYPTVQELREFLKVKNDEELTYFIQQWLSEGIPFAFRDDPFLFEILRKKLAAFLSVNPKEITLIGSARTGFSLSPPPQFGNTFNHESDLDFSLISELLFENCLADFNKWENDYKDGKVKPRNENEAMYWANNLKNNPGQFRRGLIDSNKVPNIYPNFGKINNGLWRLQEYLKSDSSVTVKKASIRIYKNWNSFIKQQKLNLYLLVDKLELSASE